MEQSPKNIEHKEIKDKKISKIHFLIHPGWLSDRELYRKNYGKLLDMYIEKAKTLGEDELMIVFPVATPETLKEDIKEKRLYVDTLHAIKEILKDRMIVLAEGGRIISGVDATKQTFEKIKRITTNRGYSFDDNVLSEAYGEEFAGCVRVGAENLNKAGGLKKKTELNPEFSDWSIWGNSIELPKKNDGKGP